MKIELKIISIIYFTTKPVHFTNEPNLLIIIFIIDDLMNKKRLFIPAVIAVIAIGTLGYVGLQESRGPSKN